MTAPSPILSRLFAMQDVKYRDFQSKLIPNVPPDLFIGIRTPDLRKYARELYKEEKDPAAGSIRQDSFLEAFLEDLPHQYFDENQLHAFVISEEKNFDVCIARIERFLPFVDNWATCDQLSPKVFKKNRDALLPCLRKWISSDHTYTVRFAIGMLMQHFLDDAFDPSFPELVGSVQSEEYYVRMMIAWYLATGLAKNYDSFVKAIENRRFDVFTHNKAIQKAIESYRVSDEHKAYLKTLRLPK
jgi:3-methyladenine DNA glycosylase AlkD